MKTKRILVDVEFNEDIYDEEELFEPGNKLFYDVHMDVTVVNPQGDVQIDRQDKNLLLYSMDKLLELEPRWEKDDRFRLLVMKLSVGAGGPI